MGCLGCSGDPVDKDVGLVWDLSGRVSVPLRECRHFDRLAVVGHVVGVDNGGRMLSCHERKEVSCRL